MDADDVSSRPKAFPSRPGENFPVYYLWREVGEFAGGQVRSIESTRELDAVGIVLHKADRVRVLIGNLTREQQTVTLRGLSAESVTVQILGAEETSTTPQLAISLPPYGIARIDRRVD